MGKSTVAGMLRDCGVPVFDADAVVHQLQGPGGALVPAIEAQFPGCTGPMGVDRVRLGAIVFGNDDALARLESIVHPAVVAERTAFFAKHAAAPLMVFDIPLLFEKGGQAQVDRIMVVSAPEAVQRERVLARPGMTGAKFEQILAKQMPDSEKCKRADFLIDTGISLEATRRQVEALVNQLRPCVAPIQGG